MSATRTAPELLSDVESAFEAIEGLVWDDSDNHEKIGLEIEAFPFVDGPGFGSRLALHGAGGTLDVIGRSLPPLRRSLQQAPIFSTGDGGRLSFEPGGQVELSTSAHMSTSGLLDEVSRTWDAVESILGERHADLVPLGLDPWHDLTDVPQQQRAERYVAMDQYFSRRWPAGATMMRNTCSLQVNVESGRGTVREERWLVANLMSPILTAMFSTSPGRRGIANMRAGIWQSIDPTRTGFPNWRTLDRVDPQEDVRGRVMAADVMFVERYGQAILLQPGYSFGRWVRSGHPEAGRPSVDDLKTHLSTIFTEVRPRFGILEVRAVDSLPRSWWMVPVVVVAGVLYDDTARSKVLEILEDLGGELEVTWRWAANAGLKAPELARAAEAIAEISLEAASRNPMFDRTALRAADVFFERFTRRGLSPADELRPLLLNRADRDRKLVSTGTGGR